MLRKLVPVLVLFAITTSCSKDKFQTTPSISIKEETSIVPVGGTLFVRMEYTDKEGDVSRGSLIYLPELLNTRRLAPNVPPYAPINLPVPDFPDNDKGEIELNLDWVNIYKEIQARPGQDKNDTIRIKLVVMDRENNTSDTAVTGTIVLLGQ
ncbi:hypothetical protein KJS94_02985 [Flavihumibacter rivuli]|uniref:hypothetical protein n=1 Tax=Flavihumibacter rivuli TaxID=2838156 RepID=UPI001BDEA1D0|nr:hypothetical protein [Flavihumibacter rivuli]ULQ57162.1 hypothetical protein KJS94_02985 [Flavihumibacter rivuli]